jgi:hypothetical protein
VLPAVVNAGNDSVVKCVLFDNESLLTVVTWSKLIVEKAQWLNASSYNVVSLSVLLTVTNDVQLLNPPRFIDVILDKSISYNDVQL